MLGTRAAVGQNAARKRAIGVLMGATNDAEGEARASVFEDALRAAGWRSGENITIEYRWAAGDPNLVRSHAAELVRIKPDVILGDGTSATAGLWEATKTIPVVFVQVSDPVGTGLVSSLAKPGGNVTGFSNYEFSMGGKWLDIIREIRPGVKRVGVLYNAQTAPFGKLYVEAINEAGLMAKVGIEVARLTDTNGIDAFVDSLSPDDEALIVLPDIFTVTHQKAIITKGGSAPFVDNVSVPLLRKCWRHRRLWSRPARSLSSLCVVCRQDSQRRKPFRTSSSAACKIQACREPEGRNCPRDISSRNLGRACRRPRRMSSGRITKRNIFATKFGDR